MTQEPRPIVRPLREDESAAPEQEEPISREGICPYFSRERERNQVYCECARFKFPDKRSRREIVYQYCAHPEGYKLCMIKQALDHYYERKYAKHESAQ